MKSNFILQDEDKQTKPNEKTNKARIIPRDLPNSEEETSTS